jgi:broad specificity phosphatase PhoE
MPSDALNAPVPTSPDGGKSGSRTGAVILTRHGEPDLSRRVRLNARGYAAWWAVYETKGLKPGQSAPEALRVLARDAVIVCSTRPRAIESSHAVADGRNFEVDAVLVEAPLPPPRWPDWLKLAPRTWGVVARSWWWFFNHHEGQESRAQAERRADEAAERLAALAEEGRDVLVMAHGFFNTMVGLALRRRGWKLVEDQGYRYWSSRRFERG